MTTGKLLRRVLLTATLTSAPLLSPDNAVAESRKGAIDRPGTRISQHKVLKEVPLEPEAGKPSPESSGSSSIQQVQYRSNNAASGNPPVQNQAVLNELNRLFKESGKEMPPMNMYSPPASNRQSAGGVNQPAAQQPRAAQQPAQNRANQVTVANPASQQSMRPAVGRTGASSAVAPPKKNLFQKFVSKLKGEPAAAASPAVPHGSAAGGLSNFSAPPPTGMPSAGAAPSNSVTASRPQVRGQVAAVNSQGQSSGQAAGQQSRQMPQQAASTNAAANRVGGSGQSGGQPRYVQPGTAPSYVQGLVPAPAPAVPASVPPAIPSAADATAGRARYATNAAPVQPALVAPAADDFEVPFAESVASSDGDEILDLDSLIEIPSMRAANTGTDNVGRSEASSGGVRGVEQQMAEVRTQTVVAGTQPQAAQASVHSVEAAVESPFTGVKLAASDEEYFQDITGRASMDDLDGLPDLDSADENESFAASQPLPPIEDFDVELPGLSLPEVDDADEVEVANRLITRGVPDRTVAIDHQNRLNVEAASQQPVKQQIPVRAAAVASGGLKSVENERAGMSLEQARRENQRSQILARAGQTGFKGFCPVMLRDQRELVDANSGIVASFGLQQYSFCSERAKAAFEADPSRYAPAAGGSDVVLLVNTAEEQAGMLDYSLWYRDRLYLFCSRETMALFSKDPSRFANQY